MSSPPAKTSRAVVLLAWLIVAIPLGWGLYQSVTKSKPLFAANSTVSGDKPVAGPPK